MNYLESKHCFIMKKLIQLLFSGINTIIAWPLQWQREKFRLYNINKIATRPHICFEENQSYIIDKQKMSFYYSINQYNLPTTVSYAPLMTQHLVPLSSIYFLQPEISLIQNLELNIQTNETQLQIATHHYIPFTPQMERSLVYNQCIQQKKVKKSRRKNLEKELQSAKKNSESNIINQLYSFFNSFQKTELIVDRAIKSLRKEYSQIQRIRAIFYNTVRLMNYKRGRRYVNKQTVRNYYTPQIFVKNIPDIEQKLEETKLLTLQELCFIFRVCTYHFIKNVSILAILSSKRISMVAKKQHLKRRRFVQKSLTSRNQ